MAGLDEIDIVKIQAQDRLVLLQSLERFANRIIEDVDSMKREMSLIQQAMASRNEKIMEQQSQEMPVPDSDESGEDAVEEDSE